MFLDETQRGLYSVAQKYDYGIPITADLDSADPLFKLLVRKARGESPALEVLDELAVELGLSTGSADRVIAAAALMKMGSTPDSVCPLLSWAEFEGFCGGLLRVAGYLVKSNIVFTKPRRQIDIFAESADLALSVDCKHWNKGLGWSALQQISSDQIERTLIYKKRRGIEKPVLPAVFTMIDSSTRLVSGVPVVPIFALRDFINSLSRFEPEFAML